MRILSFLVSPLVVAAVAGAAAGQLPAPPESVMPQELVPPADLENYSWTFVPPPQPKQVRKHDIISIRVDEMSRMFSEAELQRRKNILYDAVLKDWIIMDGLRWIKPSPQSNGDPRVQGVVNQLNRSEGELESRESLAFSIAAEVADIRPNGNLVLEAHKQIRNNNEVWEYSLTGICSPDHVGPDGMVLSRNVHELKIFKKELGTVRDGVRRGWVTKLYDLFQPF